MVQFIMVNDGTEGRTLLMCGGSPDTDHTPGTANITELYTVRAERTKVSARYLELWEHTSTEDYDRIWKPSTCYKSAEE